jgi:hypothetical protein
MVTEKVQRPIKELWSYDRWQQITKIIKDRRDELVAKILYNVDIDEKIYSECDYAKLEIRIINRLLSLPNISVEVEENLTEEEVLQKKEDELVIWDVDDLFKTQDS